MAKEVKTVTLEIEDELGNTETVVIDADAKELGAIFFSDKDVTDVLAPYYTSSGTTAQSGNPLGLTAGTTITPQHVLDFWNNERKDEGFLCKNRNTQPCDHD